MKNDSKLTGKGYFLVETENNISQGYEVEFEDKASLKNIKSQYHQQSETNPRKEIQKVCNT